MDSLRIRRIQDNIVIVGPPDAAAKESRDRVVTALIDCGLRVIPIHNLREATSFLEGQTTITPATVDVAALFESKDDEEMDFAEVNGQENVKGAMETAAAGEPPHLEAAPRRAKAA
jgi:predicted ATPase with chaperone activity